MKIGAIFPTTEIGTDPAAIRDWAQAAEGLGMTHVITYDHVLGAVHAGREPKLWGPYTERDAFHEPFVLYAWLAAHGDVERRVLDVVPARADAEPEAPTGEEVELCSLLRDESRLPLRQDQHARGELEGACLRGAWGAIRRADRALAAPVARARDRLPGRVPPRGPGRDPAPAEAHDPDLVRWFHAGRLPPRRALGRRLPLRLDRPGQCARTGSR